MRRFDFFWFPLLQQPVYISTLFPPCVIKKKDAERFQLRSSILSSPWESRKFKKKLWGLHWSFLTNIIWLFVPFSISIFLWTPSWTLFRCCNNFNVERVIHGTLLNSHIVTILTIENINNLKCICYQLLVNTNFRKTIPSIVKLMLILSF